MKDIGNSFEKATRIKLAGSRQVLRNTIGGSDREDYSRFTLKTRSSFKLVLDKLKSNVDVQLLDRQGAVLQSSTLRGKRSETISRDLASGTYYIRSFSNQGSTRYRLTFSTSPLSELPTTPEDCGCGTVFRPASNSLPSLPSLKLTQTATGLMEPTFVTNAGDGSNRIFVTEKKGKIQVFGNGKPKTTFLDISDRVSANDEQGLLSVAFPSSYASKRNFYVYYSNKAGDIVISRFQASAANPDVADSSSEQILRTIPRSSTTNHYGGQLAFDANNYLYVATGDGGVSANAQNPQSLLGKILRLEVESGTGYTIPSSNPFTAQNDPQDKTTGNLYIADVGQARYEEINIQKAGSPGGQNYGWSLLEGNLPYPDGSQAVSYVGLTSPDFGYDHTQGKSITGGYVYRGSTIPTLQGTYVYGDFVNGKIWGLRPTSTGGWDNQLLLDSPNLISTFGQDEQGNLYVTDFYGQENTRTDGVIYKLDPV
jgi:glucose/arabinose dehydrogenase